MRTLLWLVALPLRLFALAAFVLAIGAVAHDVWRTASAGELVLTPFGEAWYRLSADSLNLVQAGIQRGVHPAIWDPGVVFFLQLPAWASLFLFGALALVLARLIYRPR